MYVYFCGISKANLTKSGKKINFKTWWKQLYYVLKRQLAAISLTLAITRHKRPKSLSRATLWVFAAFCHKRQKGTTSHEQPSSIPCKWLITFQGQTEILPPHQLEFAFGVFLTFRVLFEIIKVYNVLINSITLSVPYIIMNLFVFN